MKFVQFSSIAVKLEAEPLEFVPSLKLGTRTRIITPITPNTSRLRIEDVIARGGVRSYQQAGKLS